MVLLLLILLLLLLLLLLLMLLIILTKGISISYAHKWGQYTPDLITTHLIQKYPIKISGQIWSNIPNAVGEKHNNSYVTEFIYFWFYWLLTNNEWPLPPKSELLCSMEEHMFSTKVFHKLLVFHGG